MGGYWKLLVELNPEYCGVPSLAKDCASPSDAARDVWALVLGVVFAPFFISPLAGDPVSPMPAIVTVAQS